MLRYLFTIVCGLSLLTLTAMTSDETISKDDLETQRILAKYKQNIDMGLNWLAKNQAKDGHWEVSPGGSHPIPMTALAGMALLAEGSTMSQGKYSKEIELAVEYLLGRANKTTGAMGRMDDQKEQQRYMYGHGFATMFLAQVYGEEPDGARRKELEKVLTMAVTFIGNAQTPLGGWGYLTSKEGGEFDEGSVTVTQLQALRACKNAGIPVPKEVIDKAGEYLRKSSVTQNSSGESITHEAGVTYSLRGGGGGGIRPPLTAAGICCLFSSGEYNNELAVKWINYCQKYIPVDKTGRDSFGHWEYTHLYYSQVMYVLGEDRHAKMRPDLAKREADGEKKLLKWSRYREIVFDYLANKQSSDGSWNSGAVGPVYSTALHLIIMQLDKGHLPIYQR
jgi:squalene cyclase